MILQKTSTYICAQAASYLQAHGGWDQQSLGHPPTRTSKVPAALAADYAAKRIAHPPSGSGWSCTGWGPLLSPGIALVRKWVPATQTSSIWSLSDQPATQKREDGNGSIECRVVALRSTQHLQGNMLIMFLEADHPQTRYTRWYCWKHRWWESREILRRTKTKLSRKLKQIFILQITESPQHVPPSRKQGICCLTNLILNVD